MAAAQTTQNMDTSQELVASSPSVTMENFELIRMLGKGAYGKVFLVRKVGGADQGKIYAMKVLRKQRVMQKAKTLEHTISERKVLETIRKSPFLVSLQYAFQSDSKLHLVMEYIRGGELFTHLCARGSFDLATTRYYIAELTIALDHLHQLGIFYRDLKLENVMLDEEGHIMLTDFGLSKEFEDNEPQRANSYCGTIEYMAPEVVQRTSNGYTETVDWWSLGVLTFELLTGCSPFTVEGAANSSREIAERILAKKIPYPKTMDIIARDFIEKMCTRKAANRLGVKGVADIKKHKFFKGIDWEKLEKREIPPPVEPKLAHILDVRNFSDEFTKQQPLYSPAESPAESAKVLFRGYSYVSPSVMLSNNNVISTEYLSSLQQPVDANWDIQKFGEDQKSPFFNKYVLDLTSDGYLGHGSFSVCRKCTRKDNNQQFAVKVVSQRFAQQARREAQILDMCREHPNIVKAHEVLQDSFHIYLVLELLKGPELLTKIRRAKQFTEHEASSIFRKLVSAVRFVHDKGAVHRDLKPENILFESDADDADLRLIDFGFARLLPKSSGQALNTPCFTLHYAAPEILRDDVNAVDYLPQYNQQCDLWSLGVVLYTMLSGHVPFHARTKNESASDIMTRIRGAQFSFESHEWTGVSADAKDMIRGLLTVDPEKRLTVEKLSNHTWLAHGHTPNTPLATPTVLSSSAMDTFNETINAFLAANKDGFHLAEVEAAPLLQRRAQKKGTSTRSSDQPDMSSASAKSTDSNSSAGSAGQDKGGRKRKLFPVPEESGSVSMSTDQSDSQSNAKRPETLPLESPEFQQYRQPNPATIRQTRDSDTANNNN